MLRNGCGPVRPAVSDPRHRLSAADLQGHPPILPLRPREFCVDRTRRRRAMPVLRDPLAAIRVVRSNGALTRSVKGPSRLSGVIGGPRLVGIDLVAIE